MSKKEIKIKLIRSTIGRTGKQKRTVAALGLRKMNQIVTHKTNPAILGMVDKIKHLVTIVK
ncbi:MAG: 50S ribosomal protein L30 [bacterium]|nr:MAG: 50S ribosomal protein L30 [bacterium]